ncbi:MAG: adenosylcobinamide amidohydrolase [Candidatus Bathyarchaeia archaeon]|jgi:iron complex transport system ATP-binding protein
MKFNVKIEGIEAEVKDSSLVIWSKTPMRILSSAVLNGGLKDANGIINVQVSENCGNDKNDEHWNAEDFLNKKMQSLQLPNDKVVALMTAAKMKNVAVSSRKYGETTLTVFATAGTSIAVTAGDTAASKPDSFQLERCGTINIILLIDGNLTESCMVDALKTVTEAKTVALRELDIRSRFSGDAASGTLTDSVAVACTKKGDAIKYAGTFTILGELIGKCVRESVKTAIYKQEKLVPDRPLMKRLAERGISSESIMSILCKPQVLHESPKYQLLKKQVEQTLSDRKIASLVLASLRFDDDLKKGLIPADRSNNNMDEVVFEEIIQTALRNYLSEYKTISDSDFRKEKPENENSLGPFTKCVFLAILNKANLRITN